MKKPLRFLGVAFACASFILWALCVVFAVVLDGKGLRITIAACAGVFSLASSLLLYLDGRASAKLFHQLDTAVSHSSCMVFQYYSDSDTLIVISSKFDNAGKRRLHASTSLVQEEIVNPADTVQFFNAYRQIISGKQNLACIMRLRLYPHAVDYHWYRCALSVKKDSDGVMFALGTLEDIDVQQKREQLLQKEAERDFLTGLYNRVSCQRDIDTFLSVRDNEGLHAFMLLDINGFKKVNDTQGHISGDELLKNIAVTLQSVFRSSDLVGRLGGDEFIVFMRDIGTRAMAQRKAQTLVDTVNAEFGNADCPVPVSVGVGLVFSYPNCDFADMYSKADSAMYEAKKIPGGAYKVYGD